MTSDRPNLYLNPRWRSDAPYGSAQRDLLNREAFGRARDEISRWPGYRPTPLLRHSHLAAARGVGAVWCKHEGDRFGLGSFKPTGPTYAMLCVLKAEVQRLTGEEATTQDLIDGRFRDVTGNIVISAPTSGNHGRALAWGARLFGCQAVLYMNDGVSAGRAAAIEAFGGRVVRVPGAYHDAVEQMQEDAAAHGHLIIGEPASAAYPDVSRLIMQGYAMVVDELMSQLAPVQPTHVFVPGGGGVLAGASCAHLWENGVGDRPRLVVVEPDASCCLYESARKGEVTNVPAASSVMDGLVVEEPAPGAIDLLMAGAFAFLTISDQAAINAMGQAAQPASGDPPMVLGDTGSAGWAGLLSVTGEEDLRRTLKIDEESRLAVVATEAATDKSVYRQLTGLDPDRVPKTGETDG